MLVLLAVPAISLAQPVESCKVNFTGKAPTIKDFAKAYCSQFEAGSFERQALAAFTKGNAKKGKTECIVDSKNGYVKYTTPADGDLMTLEMCFWNCNNKNEKLVAVNSVNNGMGFDESFLEFYRYNVKTRTMKHIEAPFDREPAAIELVDQEKAPKNVVNMVLSAQNEDANKYQPSFTLPRIGKNITFRMADRTAIPKQYQREGKLIWDGSRFNHE